MGTPSTTRAVDIDVQAATDITMVKSLLTNKRAWYVDGTNGAATNDGLTWETAFSTITLAVAAAAKNDVIFIVAKEMAATDTDPGSYAEKVIITTPGLALIGVSRGRTQGGLPQIKYGGTLTGALLTVRAPGCLIKNIGFNGNSTAGAPLVNGIFLDDDSGLAAASGGETKSAFGTTIEGCHFKNCAGSTVTDARTGGAITWGTYGGAWQVLIKGNRFYKNVCDISIPSTAYTVPQDIVIDDNIMSGPAGSVDCNIYMDGSGVNGVTIRRCEFQQKPAMGGSVSLYIKLVSGTVGVIDECTFGCQTSHTGGTKITFKSGGTGGDFPTTVHIMRSYGQTIHATESGEISIV